MENATIEQLNESIRIAGICLQMGLSTDGYPLTNQDREQLTALMNAYKKEVEGRETPEA
jgi:hypothetical protein